MESWILLSLLAAIIWTASNLIDKYVLTNLIKNPDFPLMMNGIIGLAAVAPIYLLGKIPGLPPYQLILALVAGAFSITVSMFYFRAAKIEEISRVVPLYYLSPLFIAALAALFLGEVFTPAKYAGMLLIVCGAALVSTKNIFKFRPGTAAVYMVLGALAAAISAVMTKYLLDFAGFWTIFAYERIGAIVALAPVLYSSLPALAKNVKKEGFRAPVLMALSSSIYTVGMLLAVLATSSGYVTLVNAIVSVQPFFVLAATVALARFYPGLLNENANKSANMQKLAAIALIFAGVVLIL